MKYFHDNNIQVTQLQIWIFSIKRPSPALSSMDAPLLSTPKDIENDVNDLTTNDAINKNDTRF